MFRPGRREFHAAVTERPDLTKIEAAFGPTVVLRMRAARHGADQISIFDK